MYPAAQAAHALERVEPAYVPGAQPRQAVAPFAPEKVPRGQSPQAAAGLAPAVPTAQAAQAVPPTLVWL